MKIIDVTLGGKKSTVSLVLKENLLKNIDKSTTLLITDINCVDLFDHNGFNILVLPPGEPSKGFDSIQAILNEAVKLGFDRNALFFGIGGGVVCDMSAFAASIYLRGCRVKLAPTTLLSMVDASVGGKTGIDFAGYKNLVGAFYPAETVSIVPEFLLTLSDSEYLSGLGEVIKTALLKDKELFEILEKESSKIKSRDLKLLEEIIIRCINVKGYFVENDFREGGIRAYLNLGHTFGHALESVEDLGGVTHGEAVVWGMLKASQLAKKIYNLDDSYINRLSSLIRLYNYRDSFLGYNIDEMIEAIKHDKKKAGNELRFILQKEMGETEILSIPESEVREILL